MNSRPIMLMEDAIKENDMAENVDTETGEVTPDISDAKMADAVVEVDRWAARLRDAKAEAKDAKEGYDEACATLTDLARRRFCPDGGPLFDGDEDDSPSDE